MRMGKGRTTSPGGAWIKRRMDEFEGRLRTADDVALGPSGRLLRESIRVEREATALRLFVSKERENK